MTYGAVVVQEGQETHSKKSRKFNDVSETLEKYFVLIFLADVAILNRERLALTKRLKLLLARTNTQLVKE